MNPPFARNAAGQEDATAAARHLAAALGALRPNGRLVAIMPDGFTPQGRRAELFGSVPKLGVLLKICVRTPTSEPFACGPACKKDPVSGVIGVQKGPLISMV